MNTILDIKNLVKTFKSGGRTLTVLNDVSFSVPEGSTISIVGPSGSGKTTLLGLVDLYTRVDLIVFIPVQNFADFCLLMLLMRHDRYLNGLTES